MNAVLNLVDRVEQGHTLDRAELVQLLSGAVEPLEPSEHRFEEVAIRALRLLDMPEPSAEWCAEMVELAVRAESEYIFDRVTHWELEPVAHRSEAGLSWIMEELRHWLASENLAHQVRALRALSRLGCRWEQMADDYENVLASGDLTFKQRSAVLRSGGRLGAISNEAMVSQIDAHLAGSSTELDWHLVAWYGEERHWGAMFAAFQSALSQLSQGERTVWEVHQLFGSLIRFGIRHAKFRDPVTECFLRAGHQISGGFEHYFQRYFDSTGIVEKFVTTAIRGFGEHLNTLYLVNLVTNSNRPAHLASLNSIDLSGENLSALERIIKQPSGGTGGWATEGTHRKESALSLASRLGLPELVDWEVESIASEQAPSLIKRIAEDCMFWGNSSFLLLLRDRLLHEGEDNPMWLIDSVLGRLDPSQALEIAIESDGRHGMDTALRDYANALGCLAASAGSCNRLTRLINDPETDAWRRHACAFGVRQALDIGDSVEFNVEAIRKFVLNNSNPEWSRDELAIALADNAPSEFEQLANQLGPDRLDSARMMLACLLAKCREEEVVKRLDRYVELPPSPYSSDFQSLYAALATGHAYSERLITQETFLAIIKNGLRYEVDEVLRAIKEGTVTEEVLSVLWRYSMDENGSWHSRPGLWLQMGRLDPGGLVRPEVLAHVASSSAASVRYFIDALIEQRTKLADNISAISQFLTGLSMERERAVGWYAAWAASILVPDSISERIEKLSTMGDAGIRSACEHAVWADEKSWLEAKRLAATSRFVTLEDYVEMLDELRMQLEWAREYVQRVLATEDLLQDWKHVQALLKLPFETVLLLLDEYDEKENWNPQSARRWYLRSWLSERIEKKLKKSREKLLKDSRLPGEEAFPHWF